MNKFCGQISQQCLKHRVNRCQWGAVNKDVTETTCPYMLTSLTMHVLSLQKIHWLHMIGIIAVILWRTWSSFMLWIQTF